MNNKFLIFIIVLLLSWIGWSVLSGNQQQSGAVSGTANREVLYWQAPMDPAYRRDQPGKSPMGMDLVPVYADSVDTQPGVVKIDPTVIDNLGVRTAKVVRGQLARQIDSLAYLGYDEDSIKQINSRVDGWIEGLGVKASGERVRKGDTLFQIYSPTLVAAQDEYLATLKMNNESFKEASRKRLMSLGANQQLINRINVSGISEQRMTVTAQQTGVVASLNIREGGYVTPNTTIMTIASLQKIWVQTEVFEKQANWVQSSQRAEVRIDALPGQVFPAHIDYVYPEIDPQTRTLKIRLRLDNNEALLRPNMYARATIFASESADVLYVPREAVIRGGDNDRIVLSMGNGRFRSQPIKTGIESGGVIEILGGLNEGDDVVTSGQFLIDSESSINGAFSRFETPSNSTVGDSVDRSMKKMTVDEHARMKDHSTMQMEDINKNDVDHSSMDHSTMDMDMTEQPDSAESKDQNSSTTEPMHHESMEH